MTILSTISRLFGTAASANGSAYPYRAQVVARITPQELPPRALYEFLKASYLSNGLYDSVRESWAATGYASPNLKAIRNPITAVVDVLGAKLYPDPLVVTTPRTQGITSQQEREQAEADDPVKAAIDQIHAWSNWTRARRKHARWVSLYGEAFCKVVADPIAGRVHYELIEPQYVTDYVLDERDFLTSCRIDIPRCDEDRNGRQDWTHTEAWSKDDQAVRIWRTEGHAACERSLWDLGPPVDEIPLSAFGIDFVPITRAPFREIDDGRAIGAVQPALEAVIEGDLSATNLHSLIFSDLAGAKVLKSIGNDAAGRPLPPPVVGAASADGSAGRQSDNTVLVGRREFWRLPGNQELQDVIPNIQYAAALAILQDHDQHLERLLPALGYLRISELSGGDLSGKAITYKMRAFVDQVEEARSNVVAALVQADMMALTMGQAAGIPGFDGLGSFAAGDFEHAYADSPILAISSLDDAEERRARAQAAQALSTAGVPLSVILTGPLEMTEAEAEEIVAAAADDAEQAFNRQAELAAAQPDDEQDDDDA
jgi:hypothetical protein